MEPSANKSAPIAKGPFGYSWPLGLVYGRGQVRLGDAVRISLGRAVQDKARFWFTIPWAVGFGVFASLSARSWAYGMTSTSLFSLFLMLLSVLPWRIRFRRSRKRAPHWTLGLNALLACALGVLVFAVVVLIPGWVFLPSDAVAWLLSHPMNWLPWSFVFPLVGLSLTISEDATQSGHRQRQRSEKLERLAEEARAAALRAQINPHFFFNALNTIAALIPTRPTDAERAVELLAEALRPALMGDQPVLSPVCDELRIARAYAELETLRWGDRVRFEFLPEHNPPVDYLDARVPSMSLQPILENAVRHGASKTSQSYRIQISVGLSADGDRIEVELRNAPAVRWATFVPDALPEIPLSPGHALHNIARRLSAHFGSAARLQVRADDSLAGWARMTVPRRDPFTEAHADRPANAETKDSP